MRVSKRQQQKNRDAAGQAAAARLVRKRGSAALAWMRSPRRPASPTARVYSQFAGQGRTGCGGDCAIFAGNVGALA